jgi:hypothetical protein
MHIVTGRRVPWAARRHGDMLIPMADPFRAMKIFDRPARLGILILDDVREKMALGPASDFQDLVDPDLVNLTKWLHRRSREAPIRGASTRAPLLWVFEGPSNGREVRQLAHG